MSQFDRLYIILCFLMPHINNYSFVQQKMKIASHTFLHEKLYYYARMREK